MLSAAQPCHRHQQLPDEIIEDIFARMPAKSVLRCRCLSRAWAAALSSDAFVDRHLDLANNDRRYPDIPRLCFLPGSAAASTVTVYAWSPPEHGKKAGVVMPLMAVPHNTRNGTLAAVTRPCRGLLLLRATAARLYYLCNPSIGQITALPDGRMADRPHPGSDYASFGLGYDARTRTHKVVRLLYHGSQPAGCDIYDVGAGSVGHWRPAASGAVPPDRVRMNQMGVFVQGHVHWVTMTHIRDGSEAIVSFSMAEEEFGFVTPPPPHTSAAGFSLTELAGFLGLVSAPHCKHSPLKSIDIWLLTGYVTRSWGKHWHVDLAKLPPAPEVGDDFMFNGVRPLALVDGGRRVVFMSGEYQVAAYSLATGSLEELVPGFRGRGHTGGASVQVLAPYEESLVAAGLPFEEILFSSPPARALSVALHRLPARALGRLKLVCRSWRAMIQSDRFVASHNACAREAAAATNPVSVIFLHSYGGAGASVVASLESCSGDLGAGRQQPQPPPSTSRVVCRKPCHGLLLVVSHPDTAYHNLCNPVTREVRSLRLPGEGHGSAGLGYDASREEHVVVHLCYTSQCLETREFAMECVVWPLRDLRPRTLASQPPIPAAVDVPPVHVDGKMFWPRERRLGTTTAADFAILAFDVCTEAFEIVPAPPLSAYLDGGHDRMVLTELAGKLCAVHSSVNMETMTVWSKTSVEGWRREHVIELSGWPEFSPRLMELVMPMAVDPIDGRILLDTGKALGYYDTRSRTLETVYSHRPQVGDGVFFIATVSEDSLLRPYNRKFKLW